MTPNAEIVAWLRKEAVYGEPTNHWSFHNAVERFGMESERKEFSERLNAAANALEERDALAGQVVLMREALEEMPHSSFACMQSGCFRNPDGIADLKAGHAPQCHWQRRTDALALPIDQAAAQVAEWRRDAERLKQRYKWRPIEEAHEDFGECVYIDIEDPGNNCMAHVCSLDYEETVEGMTHFAQAPELTEEMVDELIAAQRQKAGE
jgi:hypothetical protein